MNRFRAKGQFSGPFVSVDTPEDYTTGDKTRLPVLGDKHPKVIGYESISASAEASYLR